jgi:hypothetical protein
MGEEVHQVTCVRGKEGKVTSSRISDLGKLVEVRGEFEETIQKETADVALYTARIPWAGARNS